MRAACASPTIRVRSASTGTKYGSTRATGTPAAFATSSTEAPSRIRACISLGDRQLSARSDPNGASCPRAAVRSFSSSGMRWVGFVAFFDVPRRRVAPSSLTPRTCSSRTRSSLLAGARGGQPGAVSRLRGVVTSGTGASTPWSGPSGARVARHRRQRLDLDDVAGVRRRDDPAATDVDGDVVGRAAEEHQIARLQVAPGDATGLALLRRRVVRKRHAGGAPGPHREAGAVVGAGACAAVAVGLAELVVGEAHRDGGAPARGAVVAATQRAHGAGARVVGGVVAGPVGCAQRVEQAAGLGEQAVDAVLVLGD